MQKYKEIIKRLQKPGGEIGLQKRSETVFMLPNFIKVNAFCTINKT